MYDAGKIIIGLIVFLGFTTFPLWHDAGSVSKAPKLELTAKAKQIGHCVESKEWMKANHMQLLDHWRDAAIRKGERVYVNRKGERYVISLQNTCLECHSNKEKFCDKCHKYAGVHEPYCFDCHLTPKNKERDTWASIDENS
jgi:hypothetical protein